MQNIVTTIIARIVAAVSTFVQAPKKADLDVEVSAFVASLEARALAAQERAADLEEVAANLAQSALRERRYAKHAKAVAAVVDTAPVAA